jgi:phosphatidate cytidylyltransferase
LVADNPPPGSWNDLATRTVVGLLLAALAATAIWFGGWPFRTLVMVAGVLILLEWYEMTHVRPMALRVVGVSLFAAACLAAVVSSNFIPGSIAVASVIAAGAMTLSYFLKQRPLFWGGLGLAYAMLPCMALLYLREIPVYGATIVLWTIALVAATDTAAYFSGRLIGGPKLWPSVSPKKTWAGLFGGMACAALVGAGLSGLSGHFSPVKIAVVSAVLAVVSQGGDLSESSLKRHFDVKDSGSILPGHGGVMDRLDGLAFAAPIVAVLWWLGILP